MYDPFQVLRTIDAHTVPIITLCSIAMVFNYSWFYGAYKLARRDRLYSIPLFLTFFWLAHDASMVWRFDEMFHTYDHWYTKLFWVALVFTVLFELVFLAQAIRYGKDELLPSWSQSRFAALMCATAVGAMLVWAFVKHVLADPLYIASFHITNAVGPFFFTALVIRRRSRAGQSPLIAAGYLAMSTCWFVAATLWFGPEFRSFPYLAVWAATTAGCLAWLYALRRAPSDKPAAPDADGRM